MQPIEGHGLWDGKKVFGDLSKQTNYDGQIAVLTRATIRINRLKKFWGNVDAVANKMSSTPGFIFLMELAKYPG